MPASGALAGSATIHSAARVWERCGEKSPLLSLPPPTHVCNHPPLVPPTQVRSGARAGECREHRLLRRRGQRGAPAAQPAAGRGGQLSRLAVEGACVREGGSGGVEGSVWQRACGSKWGEEWWHRHVQRAEASCPTHLTPPRTDPPPYCRPAESLPEPLLLHLLLPLCYPGVLAVLPRTFRCVGFVARVPPLAEGCKTQARRALQRCVHAAVCQSPHHYFNHNPLPTTPVLITPVPTTRLPPPHSPPHYSPPLPHHALAPLRRSCLPPSWRRCTSEGRSSSGWSTSRPRVGGWGLGGTYYCRSGVGCMSNC